MNRPTNIINIANLPETSVSSGEKFQFTKKSLSQSTGAQKIGCRIYAVQSGKRAWPYHFHYGNEEAIFILEGSGTLRQNGQESPVQKGDYIALPVGPEFAHQLINTSETLLTYLCISTMIEPDICVYPDSNKVGVFAVDAPGMPVTEKTLEKFFLQNEVGYYEGE
ncbi:MAG: cupin domain-containing protein [Patescibacteria group bacterium]